MLTFYYNIWLGVFSSICFLTAIWKIFINNNFFFYRLRPTSVDLIKLTNPFKKLRYTVFLKWMLGVIILLIISTYMFQYSSFVFFWNHMSCTNFKYWLFFLLVVLNLIVVIYLRLFSYNKVPTNIDFFFSIANLTAVLPLLYYVNTFYSFIFFIELISTVIFYKFVVSKIWSKFSEDEEVPSGRDFSRFLPNQYVDMLFFQFWATFFSTILLFTTITTLFYLFNTTEWVSMYFLISFNTQRDYFQNSIFFTFLFIPMFFGIFLKLGLSPLHLYKIEVYEGIPFKTIFFYTTYFFLSFIVFFCFFLLFLFNSTSVYWGWFLTIFFFIGVFYTLSLLFDVDFIKAFFAYSTIINVIFSVLVVILFIHFK